MTANLPAEAARKAEPKPPVKAGGALAALVPQDLDQAFRLAQALAGAGDMVPKHFQGQPQMVMAAVMRGLEIGLAPMQALSSIAVVNGRPMVWGDALPALMQRAGHHVDVDYEGSGDSLTAVATLTRGDTGRTIVRRFSMADAKRAGLLGKAGPWTQYPGRMLGHRARGWAVRDGAADALMGMGIATAEEHGPDTARDITPSAPVAPRRGGVVYADPVDDILDADPLPSAADLAAAEAAALEHASAQGGEA